MAETLIQIKVRNCEDSEPITLTQTEYDELVGCGEIKLKLMCYRGYDGGVMIYEDGDEEGGVNFIWNGEDVQCQEKCTALISDDPHNVLGLSEPIPNTTILFPSPLDSIFSKTRWPNDSNS